MEKSLFKQMDGTYTQQGDYLLPDLILPPQEARSVGVWGERRWRYLKEYHRVLYYNLLTGGKLQAHLADVEEQAQEMFDRLTEQMAKRWGVTEALKAADMMAWVGKMNNMRNAAEEVINSDIIYEYERELDLGGIR